METQLEYRLDVRVSQQRGRRVDGIRAIVLRYQNCESDTLPIYVAFECANDVRGLHEHAFDYKNAVAFLQRAAVALEGHTQFWGLRFEEKGEFGRGGDDIHSGEFKVFRLHDLES